MFNFKEQIDTLKKSKETHQKSKSTLNESLMSKEIKHHKQNKTQNGSKTQQKKKSNQRHQNLPTTIYCNLFQCILLKQLFFGILKKKS